MNDTLLLFALATLLAALSLWLLLPRRGHRGRAAGAVLGAIALGLLASRVVAINNLLDRSAFLVLAAVTLVSAAATVTFRNPVYCAIWFALTLLGTAALLFFQGAQFLGMATIVVYAGAILVMFLFVLMLANPRGTAYYDRLSWEAWLAAPAAALLVVTLTLVITRGFAAQGAAPLTPPAGAADRAQEILADQHMVHLGRRLFSEYLLAIEVAGTLLLVALVGAIAIVAQDRASRMRQRVARHG
jgi:NADH-quinone oxidoreductase subunit J